MAFYMKSHYKHANLVQQSEQRFPIDLSHPISNSNYDYWFMKKGFTHLKAPIDTIRYGNMKGYQPESELLYSYVRILCVILSNNDDTANAALNTWAKGCNNITIIRIDNKQKLPMKKTKDNSRWIMLCHAIRDIEKADDYDWVIFVNEQTFVLMENLRWFVASLNHSQGYYLGQAECFWNIKYNVASAGYVLSKGSLKLLWREFKMSNCTVDSLMLNKEDFTLGKVLSKFDIFPIDTRDPKGYSTFNVYNWQQEFFPGVNYYKNSIYPRKCCSSRVITFKGIERDKFYMYYYILYQLDVFKTGDLGNRPIKAPKDRDYVWKHFLAEHGVYRDVSAVEYYKIWEDSGHTPEKFMQLGDNYN